MEKTIIALMYDFDKTLCTKDMQEYSFINQIGMEPENFWMESNSLAKEKKMDPILAYMYTMLRKAKSEGRSISRESFVKLGRDLEYFKGVEEWFSRINYFAGEMEIEIEHYIISSGLLEIIEGSTIYKNFKDVFACEFLYDVDSIAVWPKNVVNYTTKTQFLFRINKGVLDLSNDADLNKYTPEDERRIPFRNMIYIGDGLTDVPCMKLVKVNGGYSIAIYSEGNEDKVKDLIIHGRVDFLVPADFSNGSELDKVVKDIIMKMAMVDNLTKKNRNQINKYRRV
ncbi:MAG: haloacid dehalogenase-like hydrolase [Ruminococcaceae bacterium]|nr:haloacid dehalogenase-like hydrolase [Oscillospiraceae bacterium]